jgi:Tat protein translocase TatB subunit
MNLGMPEMIFIFLLALVVVGPKRLPGLARQLGKYMAEFKRASNEFRNQLETEMMNIELEERAKKQQEETPKILPPERQPELTLTPAPDIVSRGNSEDISEDVTGPSPSQVAQAKPPTIPASTD